VPASGRAPLTVTFSPHLTDGSFYQWQFDAAGAGSFSPDFSSDVAESVTYTFQAPGDYVTRLRIYDAVTGLPADFDLPVTVHPAAAPPVVTLAYAPFPVPPGAELTFTASATTGPGQAVLSYFWDFNADGVADFQSPGGPSASVVHSFTTIGSHPVAVTAVDGAGLAGRAETVVRPGLPPTALIDAPNPVLRGPGVDVDFTARLDGKTASWSAVSCDWDFGDGQTGSAAGPAPATVTHAYAAVGSYTATLILTDEAGHTGTATRLVLIEDGPTLRLDAPSSGKARTAVLYAQAVPPPGLSIASYVWDFGDGETQTEPGGPQSNVVHSYPPGVYTVTVTAVDSAGGTQTAQRPFHAPSSVPKDVGPPSPPPPPLSVSLGFEVDGVAGGSARAGHRFVFTARTHSNVGLPSDPYGRLLWDFDGDLLRDRTDDLGGAVDLTTTASWQYSTPGTHWVTVRAILLGTGLVHEAKLGVTVLPPVAPLECWIVQPRDGARVWGSSVTLSARTSPAGLTRRVDLTSRCGPRGRRGPGSGWAGPSRRPTRR
jgi:PKD repeat protein